MHIFGLISMFLFALCFIPQLMAILRTKNVSGLSLGLWIMVVLGHLTGLIYVIPLKAPILIASYSIGFILSLFTLILVLYYRKNNQQ